MIKWIKNFFRRRPQTAYYRPNKYGVCTRCWGVDIEHRGNGMCLPETDFEQRIGEKPINARVIEL